jgi:hypothetical protein
MPIITKSERVHMVATRGQLAAWKLCAEEAGLSLSEWLRRAAERRIAESSLQNTTQFTRQAVT